MTTMLIIYLSFTAIVMGIYLCYFRKIATKNKKSKFMTAAIMDPYGILASSLT